MNNAYAVISLREDVGRVFALKKQLVNYFNTTLGAEIKATVSNDKREIHLSGNLVSKEAIQEFLQKITFPAKLDYNTKKQEGNEYAVNLEQRLSDANQKIERLTQQNRDLNEQNEYYVSEYSGLQKQNSEIENRVKNLQLENTQLKERNKELNDVQEKEYKTPQDAILAYLRQYSAVLNSIQGMVDGALSSNMNVNTIVSEMSKIGIPVVSRNDLMKLNAKLPKDPTQTLQQMYVQQHKEETQEYSRQNKEIEAIEAQLATNKASALPATTQANLEKMLLDEIGQRKKSITLYNERKEEFVTKATSLLRDFKDLASVEEARKELQDLIKNTGCTKLPIYATDTGVVRLYVPAAPLYNFISGKFEEHNGVRIFEYTTSLTKISSTIKDAFNKTPLSSLGMCLEFIHVYEPHVAPYTPKKEPKEQNTEAALSGTLKLLAGKTVDGQKFIRMVKRNFGISISGWQARSFLRKREQDGTVERSGQKRGTKYHIMPEEK